jgi:hypothetical protein
VSDYHKALAKIEGTSLGWEDRGILTCRLFVSYGSSSQGIGGYALDEPRWEGGEHHKGEFLGRFGTAYGMEFVRRLMVACGVDSWEKLKGRTVFVLKDSDRWQAKVVGVENLPTEPGECFIFADLAREFGAES